MKITGAEILVELLVEQGVDTVFGYPGGAVLNIYDALYQASDRITHVLSSHEQGAAHAADGYARASGKTGVVIATSGPGATNLVTGIATAMLDSVPMVAITGNVAVSLLGKDSFQEVDIYGITMPITKHNFIVKTMDELIPSLRRAFAIAREGRPGPVLVDIPKDITQAKGEYSPMKPVESERKKPRNAKDVEELAKILSECSKPFIYAGGGVTRSGAFEEIVALAERLDAPVATSLMGLSCIPSAHPRNTGMIGMHGTKASNAAITESDLVVAIGARFSDRVVSRKDRFAPKAKIIHIDVDPAEINKNVRTHRHLIGDIRESLRDLLAKLPAQKHEEWMKKVYAWKADFPLYPKAETETAKLHPAALVRAARRIAGEDAFVVTDVGQHQMWVGQNYEFARPGSFLSSGGMGTMGYSLGAAIGAAKAVATKAVAKPGRVLCFVGDGGFRMNLSELATAVSFNLPVIVILMNNGVLGMVRQWQRFFYGERYSQTTLDRPPDFMKLADAFGARGSRVSNLVEFEAALSSALESTRVSVIECIIDKDELVLPMVPPGGPIDEQTLE